MHHYLPRLVEINLAENFLVELPEMSYLSMLNMSNNSIEKVKLESLYLTHFDVSFNTLEKDDSRLMLPLMETDGLQWNDHVSQSGVDSQACLPGYPVMAYT